MKNVQHPSNTGIAGPPTHHADSDPPIGCLHFTQTMEHGVVVMQSYWQPTPEERRMIEQGHSIVLKTLGSRIVPVDLVVELEKRHGVEFSEADHERALQLIAAIRESRPDSVVAYTHGSCYRFFKILKAAFPSAEALYDGDHVVTRLGVRLYDIRGVIERADLSGDPYPLEFEPNSKSSLEHCTYEPDYAKILHDMTPLPMTFKRAAEALRSVNPALTHSESERCVSNLALAGVYVSKRPLKEPT